MRLIDVYKEFAWKRSTIRNLKDRGIIEDGEILQTKITPNGIEQEIRIKPIESIEYIMAEVVI